MSVQRICNCVCYFFVCVYSMENLSTILIEGCAQIAWKAVKTFGFFFFSFHITPFMCDMSHWYCSSGGCSLFFNMILWKIHFAWQIVRSLCFFGVHVHHACTFYHAAIACRVNETICKIYRTKWLLYCSM